MTTITKQEALLVRLRAGVDLLETAYAHPAWSARAMGSSISSGSRTNCAGTGSWAASMGQANDARASCAARHA